jgi:hypothetical protein
MSPLSPLEDKFLQNRKHPVVQLNLNHVAYDFILIFLTSMSVSIGSEGNLTAILCIYEL